MAFCDQSSAAPQSIALLKQNTRCRLRGEGIDPTFIDGIIGKISERLRKGEVVSNGPEFLDGLREPRFVETEFHLYVDSKHGKQTEDLFHERGTGIEIPSSKEITHKHMPSINKAAARELENGHENKLRPTAQTVRKGQKKGRQTSRRMYAISKKASLMYPSV